MKIVDQRKSATHLPGWVDIGIGPNDVFLAKRSELEARGNWLTAAQYQLAISEKQILEPTWLDKSEIQFELRRSLEVHQWVPQNSDSKSTYLIPVFLPIGTIGKVKTISWDFEGTDDKQYWMMEIETSDGRCYDVMYPELLAASVEHK
ncbi:hypothetical protein [Lactiplantibacillus daowaiensis]|uniref:Uncharacterized protein n=1 Tax=Lactiplantibacillus daowaiensis TaxID=2559918 RepID=A0ABW1RZK6_9LACO|nr:hypothetical protein [Lactiplantibacillus daowaiensis]